MMKSITLNLYGIKELNQVVKEPIFEKYRHYYTDHNVWYEWNIDDFREICHMLGIQIYPQEIYFRGFYNQGDGSCFS